MQKKNIDFHTYVINIHSFGPKHVYDLQVHYNDSTKLLVI
jgi:hypothetical protein